MHQIKYMTADRISCVCGWKFQLEDRELWYKPRGNDAMLDAHASHVISMKQAYEKGD